jgi:hypothetical protein
MDRADIAALGTGVVVLLLALPTVVDAVAGDPVLMSVVQQLAAILLFTGGVAVFLRYQTGGSAVQSPPVERRLPVAVDSFEHAVLGERRADVSDRRRIRTREGCEPRRHVSGRSRAGLAGVVPSHPSTSNVVPPQEHPPLSVDRMISSGSRRHPAKISPQAAHATGTYSLMRRIVPFEWR